MSVIPVVLGTALALALSACAPGSPDSPSHANVASDSVSDSDAPSPIDPVHARFDQRDPLPTCGHIKLDQGHGAQDIGPAASACLEAALKSGAGAELTVEAPTPEGDLVTWYYRVLKDKTAEIYVDSTADRFGSQAWSYSVCRPPNPAFELTC